MRAVGPPLLYIPSISQAILTVALDDPEIYDEAHVSVQLVGRRLQEEKMLALAEVLDGAIKGGDKS